MMANTPEAWESLKTLKAGTGASLFSDLELLNQNHQPLATNGIKRLYSFAGNDDEFSHGKIKHPSPVELNLPAH